MRYNQDNEVNNDGIRVNNNQLTLRSTRQTVSNMWRNSNTTSTSSFADDVAQKNDEISATKPSSSTKIHKIIFDKLFIPNTFKVVLLKMLFHSVLFND